MSSTPLKLPFTPEIPFPPGEGESSKQYDAMVHGMPYTGDKYLGRLRDRVAELQYKANNTIRMEERMPIYQQYLHFRKGDEMKSYIQYPFTCEYGSHISIGGDVYIGPNCTFLDVCPIWIGDRTMIAANTQIYTPTHPIMPEERNGLDGAEWAKPIVVGNDVWIGGGVILCPGVTIGDGSTIGAGTVVTKDVPPRSVVVGNPGRVIKTLPLPGAQEEKEELRN